jgi:histidinol-phosphate phosphatase family protein
MKAVILAGGKGERLRPLTNAMPKALAPINGVPIIKQQIDNLITVGILDILVLTGYRAEMIKTYLEQIYVNSQADIRCIETPPELSPAARLLNASGEIGEKFLLLYCDNLIDDLDSISKVVSSESKITFLVEEREKGNVSIDSGVRYQVERSLETPYVELGYIKISGGLFFRTLNELGSLQMTLHKLCHQLECSVVITVNSLKSVSDISRFNELRIRRKTILLDRDGVLNKKMPHRKYLGNFQEYIPLEKNISALSQYFPQSTDYIIITNQPGLATKDVDPKFLDSLHSQMIIELFLKGIPVIGIYVCSHHWDDNCECRKPKPGMIIQAIQDFELDSENVVYIGDEEKDIQAARNAKVLGIRISEDAEIGSYPSITAAYTDIDRRISTKFG